MKFAAVSLAYNEEKLIRGCIESLKPFVDTHILAVSTKPYFGEPEPMDKTAEIAESLGAEVIYGDWSLDHHQRNSAIKLLSDYDWIFTTDADMWLEHKVVEQLIERLANVKADACVIKQKSYFKTTDYEIVDDDFMPVIAIRPSVYFTHIGCVNVPCQIINDINIHHLAWCEPKNIYKKVTTYPHAPEFNGKEWYNREYVNWTPDKGYADLPNKRFQINYNPLPDELKKYLE